MISIFRAVLSAGPESSSGILWDPRAVPGAPYRRSSRSTAAPSGRRGDCPRARWAHAPGGATAALSGAGEDAGRVVVDVGAGKGFGLLENGRRIDGPGRGDALGARCVGARATGLARLEHQAGAQAGHDPAVPDALNRGLGGESFGRLPGRSRPGASASRKGRPASRPAPLRRSAPWRGAAASMLA